MTQMLVSYVPSLRLRTTPRRSIHVLGGSCAHRHQIDVAIRDVHGQHAVGLQDA